MTVYTSDTVLKIKKKLQKLEGIEPSKQRWFYAGRMLTDKTTIGEAKIPKGHVVQVILPQPTPVENQKANTDNRGMLSLREVVVCLLPETKLFCVKNHHQQ